jgi:hypothetical protein
MPREADGNCSAKTRSCADGNDNTIRYIQKVRHG